MSDPFVVMNGGGSVVGPAEKRCVAIGMLMEELAPGDCVSITQSLVGDALSGKV